MLMWLTFIYNMFRNGPHVHVLPLRLSYCTCSRKKRENCGVIQNLLCSARAHNDDFFIFFLKILCHISGGFLPPLPRKNSLPSLSKYLSLCVSVPRWRRGEQSGAFVLPECLSQKMWTVPRISWAEIYLMHPHRVLLKSILGYGACQALSLVIYACYSLRERVHRPSLCRDHMDHTKVIEYENIEGWLCI